jgi:glycosyltransferase involved in cell wall biosynthesis
MNKKVVLFIADFGAGGAERVFANLASSLAARGCEVTLLLGTLAGAHYLDTIPASVRVEELGIRRMRYAIPAMVRYLRRERPAVVISAREHSDLAALFAARLSGTATPVIVTIHQTMSQFLRGTKRLWPRVLTRIQLKCLRMAAEIVAVSQGTADDVSKLANIPRDRIKVIYNPVLDPAVHQAAAEPLDHPWFQPGQPPVVLGIGRLTVQKDFPNLLRAFALVRKKHDARLMILGQGEERAALEGIVQSLELGEHVALPGVVKNPYAFLKRAALFALSSAWEALPTVLIEALACGCPVVSTDCRSGPREILQEGRLGKLVPVRNETALAEAILANLRGEHLGKATDTDLAPFTFDAAGDAYYRLIFGGSAATKADDELKPAGV